MEKELFSDLTAEQLHTIQAFEKEFHSQYGQSVSLLACKQAKAKS